MKTRESEHTVFTGQHAIKNFLNPEKNPYIPLVELPEHLNPFFKDKVRIFAKLMNMTPLMNVKALPALNMLLVAEKDGTLKQTHSIIENSSGNTVFSLAVIARLFGIERTKAIVSHEVTLGKLQLLRLFGTEVMVNEEPICPDPTLKTSGIYRAKQMGKRKGWFNPGQYDNEANPGAHAHWTAPQIWEQTNGKITVFCAGLGTTGTMAGVSSYLKKKSPAVVSVGVARAANNPVPGVRTSNLLREIAFDWQKVTDHIEEVGTKESFKQSLALCRAGLMAGPSSGFALHGLLQFLSKQKENGKLDTIRNADKEVIAVFICPDSPLPYLNEYFEYLDISYFPKIKNGELLLHKPGGKKVAQTQLPKSIRQFELNPHEAYKMAYKISPQEAWKRLEKGDAVPTRKNVAILDIRSKGEYLHFHLPGSVQIETHKINKVSKELKQKKIILLCPMGARTIVFAEYLRKKGVEAYSVRGGTTEWSRLNLPRWRPQICKMKV